MKPSPSMSSRDQAVKPVLARQEPPVSAPRVIGRLQRKFGPVGVDARDDVEHLLVDKARDLLVRAVVRQQMMDRVERGGARRVFLGMDLRVDVEGGLLVPRPRVGVRDLHRPDVAAPVGLRDRPQRGELRVGRRQRVEMRRHGLVIVVGVEGDMHAVFHRASGAPEVLHDGGGVLDALDVHVEVDVLVRRMEVRAGVGEAVSTQGIQTCRRIAPSAETPLTTGNSP